MTVIAEALPRVSGRHRDRVLAARRKSRALQLLSEGRTYQEVADEMGYRNRGTVHHIVRRGLEAQMVADTDQYRAQALERFEALLAAAWPAAQGGDLRAVRVAMRLVMAEVALLRLQWTETPAGHRTDWPDCRGPATVVRPEEPVQDP